MERNGKVETSYSTYITLSAINTVTHMLLGILSFLPIFFVRSATYSDSYTQHIILCSLGYVLLMGQAVLAFNPQNGWSYGLRFPDKKIGHWVMQVIGSALVIAGSVIRIQGYGGTTFSTPHGICGILALAFTCASFVGGVINLYSVQLHINGRFIKMCHSFFGTMTLIFAFVALALGFDMANFRAWSSDMVANIAIPFTIIALVGVLLSAFGTGFRRITGK